MRLGPDFLQTITCKQICGQNSVWKLHICKSLWGRPYFEMCFDKMVRHNVTRKAAARERSCLCMYSVVASMLNQQKDSGLSGREVLVQAGGLCTINVVPHTKILS